MEKNWRGILLAVLLVCAVLGAAKSEGSPHFVPPDVTAVTDIAYPINSAAAGLVTLAVNVGAAGQLQGVQTLRDIPSLTAPASAAARNWTFSPASIDGNSVVSSMNVEVVFNPGALPQGNKLSVSPVAPTPPPNPPGYFPPEVSAGSYAAYPPNSVAQGAVVLDVTVDKDSQVKKVKVLRGVASLTSQAIAAVKSWTINPATYQGKKIAGKVVVAFVFRSPTITTP